MIAGRKDAGQKFANSEDITVSEIARSDRCVTGTVQIQGEFTNSIRWMGTSQ